MPLMPSPEFGWSLSSVYSNKRKLQEQDDSSDMESCDLSAASSKRHCHSQMNPESHHMNQVEINHNSDFPNLNNNNNNISAEDIHGCMKDIVTVHQSQYLLTNTPESQPSSQNDMIMDLCDETYSNTTLETEAEIESMDNDYVPDSSQYRQPLHQHNAQHLQQTNTNNYGDESSPNRIRSYCKPTLDYMMDLRPYISDYY
ncbi:hypothetical protein LOTGIDRAFT_231624 [Lottia gigantea]|uniref:Uncharacterized protein n=1 Tax=Lottia gigantea TaxID=225164 RepID=V4C723_LOTGI|nr:hypothetical protein LOTGIDRAFT_231624 [Lottia gigantea]ESO97469.1 hypothetical protein LOTGIDRAFT_231624 [Lottia gigantea]